MIDPRIPLNLGEEVDQLRDQLAAAQAREAELLVEIERKMSAAEFIIQQNKELVAHVERLRRILECNIANLETGMSRSIQKLQANANREEIATTPEQSLVRLRNGVLEEAAAKFDEYNDYAAKIIRNMKEPE